MQDPFSDRKGITGAIIYLTLAEALPTIAQPNIIFMQDNVPVYKCILVQNWLQDFSRENRIEVLE